MRARRASYKDMITEFTAEEIGEYEARMGRMTVLDTERVGAFVLLHGVQDVTGHPMSTSVRIAEASPVAA